MYHLMRDVGGGGLSGGRKPLAPSVQFAIDLTLCYWESLFKKKDFSVQRFSPWCYLLSENLKASHLSGQIGWLNPVHG